jgi:hypothetical protein
MPSWARVLLGAVFFLVCRRGFFDGWWQTREFNCTGLFGTAGTFCEPVRAECGTLLAQLLHELRVAAESSRRQLQSLVDANYPSPPMAQPKVWLFRLRLTTDFFA